ncbi:hypothetical protein [Methanoplanus endosymbiosus]|uniref:Uncharacterized protein n=1 Tax=Methanoplanus endosymbiosus TaxID=33865 RepID=A0A9E7PLR8_9EURY|nr:hypothetical protein [Methanoplanus endosymbiosus]UUX91166.1 hypothetical protein L6E24_07170 [Methanoplanus endosymbiosus]
MSSYPELMEENINSLSPDLRKEVLSYMDELIKRTKESEEMALKFAGDNEVKKYILKHSFFQIRQKAIKLWET